MSKDIRVIERDIVKTMNEIERCKIHQRITNKLINEGVTKYKKESIRMDRHFKKLNIKLEKLKKAHRKLSQSAS